MKLSKVSSNIGAAHLMLLAGAGALIAVGGLGMYVLNNGSSSKTAATNQTTKPEATKAEIKAPSTPPPVAAAKPTESISVNLDSYMKEDFTADIKDADDYAAAAISDQTTLKNIGDAIDENTL